MKQSWFKTIGAGVAAAALTLFGNAVNAQERGNRPVGLVISIIPHPGQTTPGKVILKSRGLEERRLGEGEFVSENDEIIVPNKDAVVVISQSRGSLTICDPNSSLDPCRARVTSSGSYLLPVGKFYDAIIRITSRFGSYASTASTFALEPPGAPSIDLGESKSQEIAAGQTEFWLVWSGGLPPFHVTLASSEGSKVEGESETREITLKRAWIPRGRAILTIEDRLQRKLEVAVVVSERLPPAPDFSDSAPTDNVAQFLAAAWLSQQGGGIYHLQAAQQLRPLAGTLLIADSLSRGLLIEQAN